jgi:amino acid transporter
MSIIAYFIPYLFMFASLIRVQRTPAPPGTIRVPGGAPVAVLVGAVGFASTALSIVLACVPPPDEPNKPLAVTKVVGLSALLVAIGVGVYAAGRLRRAAITEAQGSGA